MQVEKDLFGHICKSRSSGFHFFQFHQKQLCNLDHSQEVSVFDLQLSYVKLYLKNCYGRWSIQALLLTT